MTKFSPRRPPAAVAIDTEEAVALKPDAQAKELEVHIASKTVTGADAAQAVIGKSNFLKLDDVDSRPVGTLHKVARTESVVK